MKYAVSKETHHIILDTPAVVRESHRFYEKAGFYRINATQLPVSYDYPDRDSVLYQLDLRILNSSYAYTDLQERLYILLYNMGELWREFIYKN